MISISRDIAPRAAGLATFPTLMPLLFKFQPPTPLAVAALRHREIYFPGPRELNDAHECRPDYLLGGGPTSWKRFLATILYWWQEQSEVDLSEEDAGRVSELFSAASRQCLEEVNRACIPVEEAADLIEKSINDAAKKVDFTAFEQPGSEPFSRIVRQHAPEVARPPIYLCSFTKSLINPTMWGHYANSEQGFALVFDVPATGFLLRAPLKVVPNPNSIIHDMAAGVEQDFAATDAFLAVPRPVEYRASPPEVNLLRHMIHHYPAASDKDDYYIELEHDGLPKLSEGDLGFVKSPSWAYEEEVRILFPNDRSLSPTLRVAEYSTGVVKGIVFGSRIESRFRDNILDACQTWFTSTAGGGDGAPLAIFQAQHKMKSFDLRIEALGLLGRPESQLRANYRRPLQIIRPIHRLKADEREQLDALTKAFQ